MGWNMREIDGKCKDQCLFSETTDMIMKVVVFAGTKTVMVLSAESNSAQL